MRVIAGKARGTRLVSPRGMHTRPTADRVREALFSIIGSRLELGGARIIDICAGTGSLGIEALSRGAGSCCFIERDRNAVAMLKRNLAATYYTEQADILEMDVNKGLKHLALRGESFDIFFFDPPYLSGLYTTTAETLCRNSLIVEGGLFIAEASARNILPDRLNNLVKDDRRIYGDTALEFYVLEGK
ncbi:MAG: 16S rRNA (guanine(966)-N(2))-methyltransferase RsmD [Deltaproteobacteria bacterium]